MAENLKFYDVKTKKSFFSSVYDIKVTKRGTKQAIAKAPSGIKAYRFLKR